MGARLDRIFVGALILAWSASPTGQPDPVVPPIPAFEQFVHGTNLRITLTMRDTSITVFDDPGFAVVFENIGDAPLYLNPHVVSNLRVFDERGNLMRPTCVSIAEPSGPAIIGRFDLVRLPAGGTWMKALAPEFVAAGPESVLTYWGCGAQRGQGRLLLPQGSYTARFTYLSYAGYAAGYIPGRAAGYDLREAPDVWEGRLESDAVAFSITSASGLPAQSLSSGLTSSATDGPWPRMAGGSAIDCAGRQPASWFRDHPAFAAGLCGTADAFGELRAMLDSADQDVRLTADAALAALTFVGENGSPEIASPTTPAAWDAWYREHGGESRAEWAARRLRDTASSPLQLEAAEYLSQLKDRRWLPALRAAATAHPSAWVRISAARGVAEFDRALAIAFLKRELNHRDLWICVTAVEALNALTAQSLAFDFRAPSERRRAIAAFAETQ